MPSLRSGLNRRSKATTLLTLGASTGGNQILASLMRLNGGKESVVVEQNITGLPWARHIIKDVTGSNAGWLCRYVKACGAESVLLERYNIKEVLTTVARLARGTAKIECKHISGAADSKAASQECEKLTNAPGQGKMRYGLEEYFDEDAGGSWDPYGLGGADISYRGS
ncbi:hypothetical protein B0H14DRAFT_2658669 [Mycena olivaceomarginata]|nr:hypothetical protein B0H14DRAFT_2658669 [Mycena olivaceomarginata]